VSHTKITSAAAVAAILAIASPAAFAQTSGSTTPPTARTNAPNQVEPGQILASKLKGAAVFDKQNRKIGDVRDIILDPDGRVAAIAVDFNGNVGGNGNNGGSRTIKIGMNDLKATTVNGEPRFLVTLSEQQLASAPKYELNPKNRNGNGNGGSTAELQRSQILASNLMGADVFDRQNQKIGSVKDVVLDPSGRVAEVVLSTSGRNVAVPMQELRVAFNDDQKVQKVTIDRTKNDLQSAQEFHFKPQNGNGG